MFELKKYRGVMSNDSEDWYKIWKKTDLSFQKRQEEVENFHQSTWKSWNWELDGILLSKVENVWA